MSELGTRAAWERHRNIRGPAGMMLQIHDGFRRASSDLVREAARARPDLGVIHRVFAELSSVLHHHHHLEEILLFPRLAGGSGGANDLVQEHRELTAAIDAVAADLADGGSGSATLGVLDAILNAHLDAEESIAIPYLLDNPWI